MKKIISGGKAYRQISPRSVKSVAHQQRVYAMRSDLGMWDATAFVLGFVNNPDIEAVTEFYVCVGDMPPDDWPCVLVEISEGLIQYARAAERATVTPTVKNLAAVAEAQHAVIEKIKQL